jgi:transcriptional regulator with XRE-family HTH domain
VLDKTAKKTLKTLGENLRRLRNSAGFSQDTLAAKADMTKRYVQMIEAGQKCPTLFALKRLQSVLGCRFDDLLAGI